MGSFHHSGGSATSTSHMFSGNDEPETFSPTLHGVEGFTYPIQSVTIMPTILGRHDGAKSPAGGAPTPHLGEDKFAALLAQSAQALEAYIRTPAPIPELRRAPILMSESPGSLQPCSSALNPSPGPILMLPLLTVHRPRPLVHPPTFKPWLTGTQRSGN